MRAPTWCRRRCTPSPTAPTARSRSGPRAPRRSAARTSSTACTATRSRSSSTRSPRCTATARPGRGRYREHWQASVEALGSDDPAIDAELILLYDTLLGRLGVTRYHLELNSIGCRECRPAYLETLRAWLAENGDRLDQDTRDKVEVSPLRVFDNYLAKPPTVRDALDEAPKIGESLCAACVDHFAAVRAGLDATGVRYTLVPTLVRGLDYYSRTTFEFIGPTREPELDDHRAAGATTTSWRRSAALRPRASASAPASSAS